MTLLMACVGDTGQAEDELYVEYEQDDVDDDVDPCEVRRKDVRSRDGVK